MASARTGKKSMLNTKCGGWMPHDTGHTRQWLGKLIKDVKENPQPLDPTLQEFKELIERDSMIFLLFNYMFLEIPNKPPYNEDPTGQKQVRDYVHMLELFNKIIRTAPKWLYGTEGQQGLIGFPINAVLDWPMGTASGQAAFLHDKVNAQFNKMLNKWSIFLTEAESCAVLGTDKEGWFSKEALHEMEKVAANSSPEPFEPFEKVFKCNPLEPYYGFKSWDDFFTRQFLPGVRPVAAPENGTPDPSSKVSPGAVVVSACESATLNIYTDVKGRDKFWIKDQPYSVIDMLAGDTYASLFIGGTIYQAFLSALSYHRWHSPVSGTVIKVHQQPGTYYAESLWEGFAHPGPDGKPDPDPAAPNNSQRFITQVAARAMIYIQADNPDIGLMCVMLVGMAEVSSCEVTVRKGQHLYKGDSLGTFHFGGSTHCLFFQPGVNIEFIPKEPFPQSQNTAVCSELAVVSKPKRNQRPIYQVRIETGNTTQRPDEFNIMFPGGAFGKGLVIAKFWVELEGGGRRSNLLRYMCCV